MPCAGALVACGEVGRDGEGVREGAETGAVVVHGDDDEVVFGGVAGVGIGDGEGAASAFVDVYRLLVFDFVGWRTGEGGGKGWWEFLPDLVLQIDAALFAFPFASPQTIFSFGDFPGVRVITEEVSFDAPW